MPLMGGLGLGLGARRRAHDVVVLGTLVAAGLEPRRLGPEHRHVVVVTRQEAYVLERFKQRHDEELLFAVAAAAQDVAAAKAAHVAGESGKRLAQELLVRGAVLGLSPAVPDAGDPVVDNAFQSPP
jgi:hypothetical protein